MVGRIARHMYKGHLDKAKGSWDHRWEVGMAGVGGSSGEEWWGENGDNCACTTIKKCEKKLEVSGYLAVQKGLFSF